MRTRQPGPVGAGPVGAGYVLVVEDTEPLARVYLEQLRGLSLETRLARNLAEARAALADAIPSAVLLDLRLPDGNGIDLLGEIRRTECPTAVIAITAHGSVNAAVEAMRAGADDFLVKPFTPARLATTLAHCRDRRRLQQIVGAMAPTRPGAGLSDMLGDDISMKPVFHTIELAAKSRATVFITGESGTGKELCAAAIHRGSERANRPFVAINCAAIPAELMESEMFGHVKGAFTGAVSDRDGALLRADGGTLFLDELCEMPLALQGKLLRFLMDGEVRRVGSDEARRLDVRIVCATNRAPLLEVEAGRFRADLYYRLHVIPLHVPPLRDRGGDVLLLARHFLAQACREEGRRFTGFAEDAERRLRADAWPGNVRELQNVVRTAVVLNDDEQVVAEMLNMQRTPPGIVPSALPPVASADCEIRPLEEVERTTIERAIELCGGNMTEAAVRLGVNVSTIYRKRRQWGQ